ncbi:anthranilate synthase family protein [Streptomyces sp. NPDC021020]|uniref:anthranilate synthase family protein n=1 Tax=Streptomyces sp. NPDC021020 TaxID=3365109 RepID=UPI00379875D7
MTGRPGGSAAGAGDLLGAVLDGGPPAFALIHRPHAHGPGLLDVLTGEVTEVSTLAEVPLPDPAGPRSTGGARHEVLALVPYRQITERGFVCADDGAPLVAMTVGAQSTVTVTEATERLPDLPISLSGRHFDIGDDDYAETVRRVLKEEIGTGEGANFVIQRSLVAAIDGYTPHSALAFFRRLLRLESGAYWTFLVHTGTRTFVGATPERHITFDAGRATMNPISGTYRYPATGPTLPGVMDFLADRKESDELYMVLDEELKMMTRICRPGLRVTGPQLRTMARLAHTEYVIEGRTDRDVRDMLRESLFAPTVTGSPLENACRVIRHHEGRGRGYYSGVAALIGRDAAGERTMDSAILIRTADIDRSGTVRIGVGATLVRHSDPVSEVAETHSKAAGLLAALETDEREQLSAHPDVRRVLEERNTTIAGFWLGTESAAEDGAASSGARAAGCRTLIVDAEDTFTSMLDHQLRSLGMAVTVRPHDDLPAPEDYDLVVLGPGPGDPRDLGHPKIAHLRTAVDALLAASRPFLAVCLSHQVLCGRFGLPLRRREAPNQGVQRRIDLFGREERVGFYNSFAAVAPAESAEVDGVGTVRISRDTVTGEVHALRGPGFASLQFHPESVLTQHGPRILASLTRGVLSP